MKPRLLPLNIRVSSKLPRHPILGFQLLAVSFSIADSQRSMLCWEGLKRLLGRCLDPYPMAMAHRKTTPM